MPSASVTVHVYSACGKFCVCSSAPGPIRRKLFRVLVSFTAMEYEPGSRCATAEPSSFVNEIALSSTLARSDTGGGVPTENWPWN